MIPKNGPTLSANPLTAKAIDTRVPMPTETNGLTLGMTVRKLLAAMNAEKHPPGNAEIASRTRITLLHVSPSVFVTRCSGSR